MRVYRSIELSMLCVCTNVSAKSLSKAKVSTLRLNNEVSTFGTVLKYCMNKSSTRTASSVGGVCYWELFLKEVPLYPQI